MQWEGWHRIRMQQLKQADIVIRDDKTLYRYAETGEHANSKKTHKESYGQIIILAPISKKSFS